MRDASGYTPRPGDHLVQKGDKSGELIHTTTIISVERNEKGKIKYLCIGGNKSDNRNIAPEKLPDLVLPEEKAPSEAAFIVDSGKLLRDAVLREKIRSREKSSGQVR